METEKAEALVALGYPCIEPILPELIEWMQDCNWPVAQVLQPFLASIGAPLAPHIREVLQSDDDVWKYWVISCIVSESSELACLLTAELQCIALSPTVGEHEHEVDAQARAILERLS